MTRRDGGRAVTDYSEALQDGSKILGIEGGGSVVYSDPVREVTLGGELDPRDDLSELRVRDELGLNESLGDHIEEIESSVGWQELSEFARELLGEESTSESSDEPSAE
jgi:hypothetical protein